MNKPVIKVDAIGDSCPIPVVKAKKALAEASPLSIVEVMVDNETSAQNLLRLGDSKQLLTERLDNDEAGITIRYTMPEQTTDPGEKTTEVKASPVLTVSITSDQMGQGDESLGRLLLKGFIYALTEDDVLPRYILLYNKGAFVSCNDSASLTDLKALEAGGTEILTCGTCLDFYKIKDKLAVGEVTNMYRIVEILNGSDRIISP